MAAIDTREPVPVGRAVLAGAGRIDIANDVLAALGAPALPVAAAVRDEAGSVDVADAVLARIRRASLAPSSPVAPAANTDRWLLRAVLAIAAIVLAVVGGRELLDGPEPIEVLRLASLDEVTVDSLEYGENAFASLVQSEGEGGDSTMILWIEEETTL
jgi:hypothetical protein